MVTQLEKEAEEDEEVYFSLSHIKRLKDSYIQAEYIRSKEFNPNLSALTPKGCPS